MELTAAQAYLQSLQTHIRYVQEAGMRLGVPLEILKRHDESKFSRQEFMPYAYYFFNKDGTPRDSAPDVPFEEIPGTDIQIEYNFTLAWKHHLQHNDHHWQHWILRNDNGKTDILPMPYIYIHEMVADWMGASMAYTKSWDMTGWLNYNLHNLIVHPETARVLHNFLHDQLDYSEGCLEGLNPKFYGEKQIW